MRFLPFFIPLIIACTTGLQAALVGVADAPKPAPLPEGALFQTGPDKDLQRLSIAPDGKTIATASESGAVVLWDASTGKSITTIAAHDKCYGVDFSLDGKSVFSCGADKLVKQWDVASGKMIKQFAGHTAEVKFVACCPDGKRVASCEGSTATPAIRVWDIVSGNELKVMTGHGDNLDEGSQPGIDILNWSPDGRKLLTEASDETARLWDAIAGKQFRILPQHDNSVAAVAISPDNSLGASARHPQPRIYRDMLSDPFEPPPVPKPSELRIWKMSGAGMDFELAPPHNTPKGISVRRIITGFDGDITCVAFAPDARTIISGSNDEAVPGEATVRQWDIESGIEIRRFVFSSRPIHAAVFPDGSAVAVLSAREGLTVLKLKGPPPGGAGQTCIGIDDAWTKLDSPDYPTRASAFQFVMKNTASEQLTAELLRRSALPADSDLTKQAQEAIAGLDSDNYSIRVNSADTLRQLSAPARPELIAALNSPSNEVRVRAAELLREIGGVQSPRRVLVLEMLRLLDRPEARDAIQTLQGRKDKK